MIDMVALFPIRLRCLAAVLLCFAGSANAAEARDFMVASADEVTAALDEAKGGDRILLAAGNYGKLGVVGKQNGNMRFSAPVEILSKDKGTPAVIAALTLSNIANLTFTDITFDYVYVSGDEPALKNVLIRKSENIIFKNCVFDGDEAQATGTFADGHGTGIGLHVSQSKSVTLDSNLFRNWLRAAAFSKVGNLVVKNNEVTDIRSDGFDFAEISTGLIEANHIHDFRMAPGSPDHRDMIQFWTNGTENPSTDIIIRNNFLDKGRGDYTQSIFMRNELVDKGQRGDDMFYRNILIVGNLIRNAHANGIVVGESHGLVVRRNTMLEAVSMTNEKKISVPSVRISEGSTNVVVTGNIVPRFARTFEKASGGWNVSRNLIVQRMDQTAPNYYGELFVNALADKTMDAVDLSILPSSTISASDLGSPQSIFNVAPATPIALITNSMSENGILSQDFTVPQVYNQKGALDITSASISWNFGDGGTSQGQKVSHIYEKPGKYEVEVVVRMPSMASFSSTRSIVVGRFAPDR